LLRARPFAPVQEGAAGGSGMMCAESWEWRRVGSEGSGVVVARSRWLQRQWYVYTVLLAWSEIFSSGEGEGMAK